MKGEGRMSKKDEMMGGEGSVPRHRIEDKRGVRGEFMRTSFLPSKRILEGDEVYE